MTQRFTLEQIEEGMSLDLGFCIQCGAEREYCEPDAREYSCNYCGECAVYGAEELVIMGFVD